MARTKHKGNLSSRELMQLTLWGGLLLVILIGLVYGLVRVGAVIPVGSGLAASRGRGHSRCHSSFAPEMPGDPRFVFGGCICSRQSIQVRRVPGSPIPPVR